MILRAAIRLHGDTATDPHPLVIPCTDYASGMVEVRASTPEGWDVLHVIIDRD